LDPPTLEVPGVKAGAVLLVTGMAGKGAVFPVIWLVATVLLWLENLQSLPAKVLQASKVLPDHTQKPEVIPTARLMKYLSISTEKSGYARLVRGTQPGQR